MKNVEEFITIKTLRSPSTADLYKARLEAEGIECYVFNSTPVLPVPMGGIRIEIKATDEEKAKAIIEAMDEDFS